MNTPLQKAAFWVSTLSLCSLLLLAMLVLLFGFESGQDRQTQKSPLAEIADQVKELVLPLVAEQTSDYSRVLLPLGPDEGRLPGFDEIWSEFSRAGGLDGKTDASGYDGIQAAQSVAEFSLGSVTEVFLSGLPLQAFHRGNFIFSLDDSGKIQIVDCSNQLLPKLSSRLPYQHVLQMEMRGDLAYLLIGTRGSERASLVIADLRNPLEPHELAQLDLPGYTTSFFVLDGQLVAYTRFTVLKGETFVHLFDLTKNFELIPLGSSRIISLEGAIHFKEYLLTKDTRAGLHVLDFRDPLQPVVVASVDLPEKIRRLTHCGDIAFALGDQNRMYVIDFHDSLQPVIRGVIEEANHFAYFTIVDQALYYFTENGYLRVYNFQQLPALSDAGLSGELISTPDGEGFALLGDHQGAKPATVTEVLTLPEKTSLVDKLFWREFLVILDDGGLIKFFRKGKDATLELSASLQLPSAQHWLASSDQRLYVGGESAIHMIAEDDPGHFVLSGQFAFPGEGSWDGLIVENTLCVAAGKAGVLCFSAEQPDQLTRVSSWEIPRHLQSQLDVRLVVSSGKNRVMAAAGPAGFLSGQVNADGQLQLDGYMDFPEPIYALAVLGDFCLISTGSEVSVVDIRDRDSLQNLGDIAFPGVTRFAVAAPDLWAGYVPERGWSVLPAPYFVSSAETERLQAVAQSVHFTTSANAQYRLELFNEDGVVDVPGAITLSSLSADSAIGVTHGSR